jgi:acyl-CoA synthetase (AMP-forming)/AMP-acid ligase II
VSFRVPSISPLSLALGDGQTTTMLHALARTARENPTRGITLLGDDERDATETRSYGELARSVWELAGRLQAQGIAKDERVLVVLPTGLSFVETFLALQLIGAVPVPAEGGRGV